MKKIFLLLILTIFVSACLPSVHSETGKPFNIEHFNSVKENQTTKKDLVASLGNPEQVGLKENGKETWTYSYFSIDARSTCFLSTTYPKIDIDFMRMTLTFDKDVVVEKSYDMSSKRDDKKTK